MKALQYFQSIFIVEIKSNIGHFCKYQELVRNKLMLKNEP